MAFYHGALTLTGARRWDRSNKWLENVISRQLWEGAISAGLVHISVELHAASAFYDVDIGQRLAQLQSAPTSLGIPQS